MVKVRWKNAAPPPQKASGSVPEAPALSVVMMSAPDCGGRADGAKAQPSFSVKISWIDAMSVACWGANGRSVFFVR